MATKVEMIQTYLKEQHIDAAFITTPDNVFYLSGFKSDPYERLLGVMVFKDAEPFMICPKMEVPDALAAGWGFKAVGHDDQQNAWEILRDTAAQYADVKTLAIEKSHVTVERLELIQSMFTDVKVVGLDKKIADMRLVKSADELQKMREAAKLADYAIQVGCDELAEGKTEIEVLSAIEAAILKKGYYMSFDTMVLTGLNAASPHGTPGNTKIQKGDLVLFDLGVVYEGYCSDITRTVAFGEPRTEEQRRIYETVRASNEAAIKAVKPGVRAMDLDKVSRDVIDAAGYGEYYTHRMGHGLGISVHEEPSMHGANEKEVVEGMVFTIEPGIYKGDAAGVRIEDDVYVTADGVEVLTSFPKALQIIEPK